MKLLKMLTAVATAAVLLSRGASAQMGDGTQTLAMGNASIVRGTVTGAAASRLTVRTEAGESYEVVLTPNTQLRKGRDPLKLAEVHAGDGIGAMGEIDAGRKTVHALFVTVVDAEQLKKAREAMGKSAISGTVTAIHELKLTIKRTDDVVQVIQVDEDTSFRKGGRGLGLALGADGAVMSQARAGSGQSAANVGESLTLADVKVGSVVAGKGSMKNGIFMPTELAIGDAAAPGQRRRQDGTGPFQSNRTTTPPVIGTEPK